MEFENIDVRRISKSLRDNMLRLSKQDLAYNSSQNNCLRQQYESWNLIEKLAFVDQLFHELKNFDHQACPKTFVDELTMK